MKTLKQLNEFLPVKKLGNGKNSKVWYGFLKGKNCVLKLANNGRHSSQRISSESLALRRVSPFQISPKLILNGEINRKQFIVMEFLQAEPLSKKLKLKKISPEIIKKTYRILKILSDIKVDKGFGYLKSSQEALFSGWGDFLETRYVHQKRILKLVIKEPMFSLFDSYVKEWITFLKSNDVRIGSLMHGDINGENILISNNGKEYLIDWENVMSGDHLADLAIFCNRIGERKFNYFFQKENLFESSRFCFYRIFFLSQDLAYNFKNKQPYGKYLLGLKKCFKNENKHSNSKL